MRDETRARAQVAARKEGSFKKLKGRSAGQGTELGPTSRWGPWWWMWR